MKTKEIIKTLRVCADEDILCPACPRYKEHPYGGSAKCYMDLMQDAADALEDALLEQEERENPKPLSAFLTPMDSYTGLKRKFLVFKSDTGEMIENCFVLRPDKDPAAVAALRAYAGATDNKTLAADIINLVGKDHNEPLTLEELRKMDGEPVWIKAKHYGVYADIVHIIGKEEGEEYVSFKINYRLQENGQGKTWLAYRSKPKEDSNAKMQ